MPQEIADEALLVRFVEGDEFAFEELYRRYRRRLYAYIFRFVGAAALADETMQEVFLRVAKGAADFEARAKFSTWLYTVARNLCIDVVRRERLRRAVSLQGPIDTIPSPDAAPDRRLRGREAVEIIAETLDRLPDEQREVFVLREQAGVRFPDIAIITGAPENTVKSRMRYALGALRRALMEAGIDSSGA